MKNAPTLVFMTLINGTDIFCVLPNNNKSVVEKLVHESIQGFKVYDVGYDKAFEGFSPLMGGIPLKDLSQKSKDEAIVQLQSLVDTYLVDGESTYDIFTVPTSYGELTCTKVKLDVMFTVIDLGKTDEKVRVGFMNQFQD